MTAITELGEFGLIARLTSGLTRSPDVVAGVGDDAAILDIGGEDLLVATCDAQVEDTHFRLRAISPHDLGRRVLAVNISDIAAMGARPRFALISLLLPPTCDVALLDGIYAGLQDEATRFGVSLVGGNVARNAERLILDITLLGTGKRDHLLQRNCARPGEVIMVTGNLGSSAAGLLVLEDQRLASHLSSEHLTNVLTAQRTPTPRVVAGQWLVQQDVKTGIDISDGLAADLAHICAASGVGATINAEALPILPEVRTIAALTRKEAQELALFGGEDYELIFTVPAERVDEIVRDMPEAAGVKATPIGTIDEQSGLTLIAQGKSSLLQAGGWNHLA
jgi:thiamine-monophosphate kinase